MKKVKLFLIGLFCLAVFFSACGCASLFRFQKAAEYPLSFDQTYLIALSALDDMDSWRLLETDHKRGLITIEKSGYLQPTQQVSIMVKRLDPYRSKIELYDKWATPFTKKFFKAVERRMEEMALTYPT